ncbi:NifX-associated nitrogen fixation protein, partial [Salmonella enterica subsp. enterica serovar Typhimurium]|nr:NifX-associated nitrogen fixation protein [Salmonella enterica subsp. enterica serovar Typhimurium]
DLGAIDTHSALLDIAVGLGRRRRQVGLLEQLRDAHRFGFPTYAKLAEAGQKFVDEGVGMVNKYNEVANWG